MLRTLNNSMIYKLLVSMCGVLLLGGVLFGGALIGGGSIRQLEDNAFGIFTEKAISRRNHLQNDMLQSWSNLAGSEVSISRAIEAFLSEQELALSRLSLDHTASAALLNGLSSELIGLLRGTATTGVFVVLNSSVTEERGDVLRPGIYLRDLDPQSNPAGAGDLLLERGPASTSKLHGIPLDTFWEARFRFSPSEPFAGYRSDYYDKPVLAARASFSSDIRDMGYWSLPFRFSENDLEVITYSVPLLGEMGSLLGVLGVEISLDYLRQCLPYSELHAQYGGYLLAVEDQPGDGQIDIQSVAYCGPILLSAIGSDHRVHFDSAETSHPGVFLMRPNRGDHSLYGSFQPLSLYNTNTPFVSERWGLVGIMREAELTASSHNMLRSMFGALLASMLVGGFIVLVIARRFVRPITNLAAKVRFSDPAQPVRLEAIGFGEIDELSRAIETMSLRVAQAASRMAQIIALTEMPIAVFECSDKYDSVFCTDLFCGLMGIEDESGVLSRSRLTRQTFNRAMARVMAHPEPSAKEVYRLDRTGRPVRWLRITTRDTDDGRQLGVVMDVTAETLDRRRIEHERDYDTLTLLLNRRAFNSRVMPLFEVPGDLGVAAFIMWDLDNLKYINDTYGHDLGDEYLRKAASVLKDFSLYNGIAARMSGDEFYVFIYGHRDKESIRDAIASIRANMDEARLLLPDGDSLRVCASAGVAWYPSDASSYEQLLKCADFAMYEVKSSCKGSTSEFDLGTYHRDAFLLHGRGELNRLIDESLVRYAFQPIVDVRTGAIFGYEALMRPQLPTLTSPLDVVRLARDQSKLYQIEQLTWRVSLSDFAQRVELFGDAKLFINSIPNHALSEEDIHQIEWLYEPYLDRIVVELIESEQSDSQCCLKKQEIARRWNAQMALDDFGSGYSNDLVLLSLAPDYVKVDMSIVRGIDRDPNRQKLLQNLISYARERGIRVIAEGVETAVELRTLAGFGVDYLQGFYLGVPSFDPAPRISDAALRELERCAAALSHSSPIFHPE